ncbi:p-loop containing nucleoside triphosphate hydrolase protein [Mycena indigotica]|uniref:p-loop containing nucleoside triphosphate hydrolase protein n=1 Tax=Mycena indigotica TaxID=2126181 RepID=A0A8H6SZX5_9AGAR|nr:p-loop containing nucleoside triphosphate hydrolase protein [Mycena indigotica]KAF7309395.1 p-loop containing nucleoside triphosphate hydrolase protein [Mycena indigotica]
MSLALIHAKPNRATIIVAQRRLLSLATKYEHPSLNLWFNNARYLVSASSPASIPKLEGEPEVVIVGRANVGKSTMLNLLLTRNKLVTTSSKPGGTKELKFFRVEITAGVTTKPLVLVDSPGYGSRGRAHWGQLFDQYIQERKQLKRIYICFNARHMLKDTDLAMLEHLSKAANGRWTIQPIFTKIDAIPENRASSHILQMIEDLEKVADPTLVHKPFMTGMVRGSGVLGVGIVGLKKDLARVAGLVKPIEEIEEPQTKLKLDVLL